MLGTPVKILALRLDGAWDFLHPNGGRPTLGTRKSSPVMFQWVGSEAVT